MNFEIYCDESCQEVLKDKTAHNYMGLGGIWIPSENRKELKEGIKLIKDKHNIKGEIKWKKVSPAYINFYKEIIEFFFKSDFIRARIIVIDTNQINNTRFNKSDNELGFYKFYYQLLHHWILDYNSYSIYLDMKMISDKTRIKVLNEALQNSNLTSEIKNVQSIHSHESVGIQLADLLTGIVLAKFNNKTTSKSKKYLIEFVESQNKRIIAPTPKGIDKLNIFKINLQGGW